MIRKLIKWGYLTLVKWLNQCIKKTPKKNNILFFMTFHEDILPIVDALMSKNQTYHLTLLYHPKYESLLSHEKYHDIVKIPLGNKYVLKHLFAIKSAQTIVIDTYYLMLGSISKHEKQEVIQVWHASSALKKFGLEDASVDMNDKKSVIQYQSVYDFTDTYVVAGQNMEAIFKSSLNAHHKQFLHFGLHRLNQHSTNQLDTIKKDNILFVPTYRDYKLKSDEMLKQSDIEGLLIKAHPSDHNYKTSNTIEFESLASLIENSKVVITDYSSLAIEAAYKNKPVILYVPDEKKYRKLRGLNEAYDAIPKDNKAYHLNELRKKIENPKPFNITNWVNYQMDDALNLLTEYIEERSR